MVKQRLLDNHKSVKESLSKLTRNNLHSFDNEFSNLYNDVIFEYTGDKEHSDFYHVRKIIEKMGNFNSVADEHKEGEFLTIKGEATAALRDLELLIHKMK